MPSNDQLPEPDQRFSIVRNEPLDVSQLLT
jgi:hypothetical protein